jgi:hypothetical protein
MNIYVINLASKGALVFSLQPARVANAFHIFFSFLSSFLCSAQ